MPINFEQPRSVLSYDYIHNTLIIRNASSVDTINFLGQLDNNSRTAFLRSLPRSEYINIVEKIVNHFIGLPDTSNNRTRMRDALELVEITSIEVENSTRERQSVRVTRSYDNTHFYLFQESPTELQWELLTMPQQQENPVENQITISRFQQTITNMLLSYFSFTEIENLEKQLALKDAVELELYNDVNSLAIQFAKIIKEIYTANSVSPVYTNLLYIDSEKLPFEKFSLMLNKACQLLENTQESFSFNYVSESSYNTTHELNFSVFFLNARRESTFFIRWSNVDATSNLFDRFSRFRSDLKIWFLKNVPNTFRLAAKMVIDRSFRPFTNDVAFSIYDDNSGISSLPRLSENRVRRNIEANYANYFGILAPTSRPEFVPELQPTLSREYTGRTLEVSNVTFATNAPEAVSAINATPNRANGNEYTISFDSSQPIRIALQISDL